MAPTMGSTSASATAEHDETKVCYWLWVGSIMYYVCCTKAVGALMARI